jgi:hypothetical protein
MPGVTTEYVFGDWWLTVLVATLVAFGTVGGLVAARSRSRSPKQYARRGGLAYACVYVSQWAVVSTVYGEFVTSPLDQLAVLLPVLGFGLFSYGVLAGSVLYLYASQELRTPFAVLLPASILWGIFVQTVGDGELGATGDLFIESYLFVMGATVLVWVLATAEAWIRSDTTIALLATDGQSSDFA